MVRLYSSRGLALLLCLVTPAAGGGEFSMSYDADEILMPYGYDQFSMSLRYDDSLPSKPHDVARPFHDAVTFSYQSAADLVRYHLQDTNEGIDFRNIGASERSCYALFANGYSVGKNIVSGQYAIPDWGLMLSTGREFNFGDTDGGEGSRDAGEEDPESMPSDWDRMFDPCYIQFEFKCPPIVGVEDGGEHTVSLDYVFGSEEYYREDLLANNDAFGVFLNDENIALVPGGFVPVSVGNVNDKLNSDYFVSNEPVYGSVGSQKPYPGIAVSGFTTELTASGRTEPGWNTIKLVVGDAGNAGHDSWALLKAGSFTCEKESMSIEGMVDDFSAGVLKRRYVIPMEWAVGSLVLLGIVALLIPCACLLYYRNQAVAPSK